jgi:hypothetical protein
MLFNSSLVEHCVYTGTISKIRTAFGEHNANQAAGLHPLYKIQIYR